MKFMSTVTMVTLSCAIALASINAEAARRMGGGKSIGQQSQNVTRQQTAPAPQSTPQTPPSTTQSAAPSAAPTQTAKPANAPAAPAPASKPWGAMLGGLAAGLGLAWLANSLGLGGALSGAIGSLLVILLTAGAAFLAFNAYRRYKASQKQTLQPAYAGSGYSPKNVGNDAAARPFERNVFVDPVAPAAPTQAPTPAPTTGGSMIGSALSAAETSSQPQALSGAQSWGIPANFDTAGFLAGAKTHFVNLQAAWDKADVATLRNMLTSEMMGEIEKQLAERQATGDNSQQRNEVVAIEARLLGIEEISAGQPHAQYLASVEFSGQIREDVGQSAEPFTEVWNLTKPVSGGGWLVAGIQTQG